MGYLKGLTPGDESVSPEALSPILSNEKIFAVNLYELGLGEKIEGMFIEMMAGKGAVRETLKKYLK